MRFAGQTVGALHHRREHLLEKDLEHLAPQSRLGHHVVTITKRAWHCDDELRCVNDPAWMMSGEYSGGSHHDGGLAGAERSGAECRRHAVVRPGHDDGIFGHAERGRHTRQQGTEHGERRDNLGELRRVDAGARDQVSRPTNVTERAVIGEGQRHRRASRCCENSAQAGVEVVHRLKVRGHPVVEFRLLVLQKQHVSERRTRVQAVHRRPMRLRGVRICFASRWAGRERLLVSPATMIHPRHHRADGQPVGVYRNDRRPLTGGAHNLDLGHRLWPRAMECLTSSTQHRLPHRFRVLFGLAARRKDGSDARNTGTEDGTGVADHGHLGRGRSEIDGESIHGVDRARADGPLAGTA